MTPDGQARGPGCGVYISVPTGYGLLYAGKYAPNRCRNEVQTVVSGLCRKYGVKGRDL